MDYWDNRQRWTESHQVVHFYASQWCTFTPALTHVQAVDLTRRAVAGDCILLLQSLAEFFYAVSRKGLMTPDAAAGLIDDWRAVFPVCSASGDDLAEAITVDRRHRLSFWDAMLWATAREAGCKMLLSEDFQDGREIGGVRFVNPFLAANDDLLALILPRPD